MKIDAPVLDFCKKHSVVYLNKIELIQCIMNGMSIRKAAEEVGLSYLTVNSFLRDFYRRHGYEGRKDLMAEIYKYSRDEVQTQVSELRKYMIDRS